MITQSFPESVVEEAPLAAEREAPGLHFISSDLRAKHAGGIIAGGA